MHILPIGSGKGGVGKSLVATNLAIALAQAGKKVVLADLDLGGSNIHLILGIGGIKQGLGTFLASKSVSFEDIIIDTDYKNLRFLPGDAEIPGMANLTAPQKSSLLKRLFTLDADYLIMDLGAGTSYNTVDFFLSSGQGLVVTSPTLTATLNAYLFLKNCVFRLLNTSFKKSSPARTYLDSLRQDGASLQKVYIPKLLDRISQEDPDGFLLFQKKMKSFRPRLILNMLEDPKDSNKANKIRRSCREYLDVDMEHLGIVYRDHLQDIALAARLPIIVYKPQSVLAQAIYRIADKVMQTHELDEGLIDVSTLDESYQVAAMEAEIDFDAKIIEMERLMNTSAFSKGDLIETIKTQQYEINSLKKENQLIKHRLVKAANAGFKL